MWLVRHCIGQAMSASVFSTQILLFLLFSDFFVTYFGILSLKEETELSLSAAAVLGLFQGNMLLATVSHIRCIVTKPGRTPHLEPPDIPLSQLKFCEHCNQWKPPRTHHCRICGICIHRVRTRQMDHHCKWINNCVGVKTHKYFLLFVMYFTLAGAIAVVAMSYNVYSYFYASVPSLTLISLIFNLLGVFIGAFICLIGFVLLYQQLCNLANNELQLEQWQDATPLPVSIIQRNLMANLEAVLGINRWAWMIPVKPRLKIDFEEPLLYVSSEPQKPRTPLCQKAVISLSLFITLLAGVCAVCVYFRQYL